MTRRRGDAENDLPVSPSPRLRVICFISFMNAEAVEQIVKRALAEDLPDITSEAIFEPEDQASAAFVAKGDGVIAGHAFARATFHAIDIGTGYEIVENDGTFVHVGDVIARIAG